MFEYILHPIFFYYCQQILYALRGFSLLSPIIDVSGDIGDDEGSFQFSPGGELASPLYVHITLAKDTGAE